jgi:hypothetical protein
VGKSNFTKTVRIVLFLEEKKLLEKTFTQGPVVFGRLPSSDVHLDFDFVSGKHCQVTQEGSRFFLVDLSSRNGLFVAGQTVDRYQIDEQFEFVLNKIKIKITVEELQRSIAKPQFQIPGLVASGDLDVFAEGAQTSAFRNSLGAMLSGDFISELVQFHPGVKSAAAKRIEAVLLWHDQVFEVREFDPSERITLGASPQAELRIPSLPRGWALANVDFNRTHCFIPKEKSFSITREGLPVSPQELLKTEQMKQRGNGFTFNMGFADVLNVDLGGGMRIFLRYIPATQKLTKKKMTEPEQALKQAMLGSALMHGILALLLMISVPEVKNIPKLDNVPERFAKLLVQPPKPILPVIEPPKLPEPTKPPEKKKEIVKKEVIPPKKVVKRDVKPSKKMVEQNKFPIIVKTPPKVTAPVQPIVKKPEPKPVNVESLGALAALGAISDAPTKDMPQVSNIQINKNAGGASSKVANTNGVLNAIPSSAGRFLAASSGPVKTGGKGIGSGKEYGVQGLAGASGSRGIGAAVVGSPQLATAGGKSEGLTRAQVMDVVKKYLSEVQQCYERNLLSNPNLAGRMEFEWDIQPAGKVSAVRVRRSTVEKGDNLGECVKGVFAKMQFPKARNGQSTTPNIGFPFGRM